MPTMAQIQDYLQRSGDECYRWDLQLLEFEGGWLNWEQDDNSRALVVMQAYGDHNLLLEQARHLARTLNAPRIAFCTRHNGKAMARLFKGRVIASIVEIDAWAT